VSLDVNGLNGLNADFAKSTAVLSGVCKHQVCLYNWPINCQVIPNSVIKKLSLP